jgi:putative mycofactocin binding protein MftB
MATRSSAPPLLDLDLPWQLHPSVAVRPEEFGALLYDFRTRRLSFLTSRTLLATVLALPEAATARKACDATCPPPERPAVERGLEALVGSGMLERRPAEVPA